LDIKYPIFSEKIFDKNLKTPQKALPDREKENREKLSSCVQHNVAAGEIFGKRLRQFSVFE
jgi:hypothetical protein